MRFACSRLVALAAVASAAVACGKMGDPRAPLRPVPAAVTGLTVERTSDGVLLVFKVPDANTDGSTPPAVESVEVYALTQPATSPAPTPADLVVPAHLIGRIPVRRFDATPTSAKDTRVAPGAEGSYVDSAAAPSSADAAVRYYAVTGTTGSRRGPVPRLLALPLSPLKSPPAGLAVDYNEQTITLIWTPASVGDRFIVEEVDAAGTISRRATPAPLATAGFTTPVEIGRARCFAVRTVEAGTGVLSLGPLSPPSCVTPVDRFPPAPPTNPSAFPGNGAIDLLWTASASSDVAGYIVLRGDGPDGTLQPLTAAPIAATQYRDQSVKAGAAYSYQVIAVDKATPPNRSEPSTRVVVTVRQPWRPG